MVRPHQAAVGTLPARQRLHPDHLAVGELHLRLEPGGDLAVAQRLGERLHPELGHRIVRFLAGVLVEAVERRFQLVAGQRLLDAAEHAQAIGAGHGLHGVEQGRIQRADHHHRARQPLLRDVADAFDAVHARHVQVHQHHVGRRRLLPQHLQRMQAVGAFQHLVHAEFGKQAHRDPALEAVILHHHHLQFLQGHAALPSASAKAKPTPAARCPCK